MVKKQGSRPIVPKGVVPAAAAGGAAQPRRDGQPSSLQLKKQQHHAHPNGSAKHAGTPQQALHTQQQQGGRQQGAGHGVHKPARHHPLAGPSSDGDAERPHKKPRWSGPGADGTQVAAAAHGGMATQQQQQQSTSGQHQHQHHHQHHHRHHHYHHKHHGHAGGQKDEQTGRPAAAAAAGGVAAPGAAVTAPAKPVAAVNGKGTAGVGPSVAAPAGKPAAPKAAASAAGPAGSNWAALKHAIGATGEGKAKAAAKSAASAGAAAAQRKLAKPASIGVNTAVTHVVALDCEMVGVGSGGGRSALARVCIVNDHGNVLLDSFVKPKERVTDYRTAVSGVRPSDLAAAISFDEAQAKVDAIFKAGAKILVGHALSNDLKALMLSHPRKMIRDTASYRPLMRSTGPGRKPRPLALRVLAEQHLGLTIQMGEHSPVDDARAALYLYHKHKRDWEHAVATGSDKADVLAAKAVRKAERTAGGGGGGGSSAAQYDQLAAIGMMARASKKRRLQQLGGGGASGGSLTGGMLSMPSAFRRAIKDDPMADL